MMPRTLGLSALLIAVGCTPPWEPPVAEIPVSEALAVVDPLEPSLLSLTCGYGIWDGKQMPVNWREYYSVRTPWKWRNVDRLRATYAQAAQGDLLISINVGGHEYRRDDPSQSHLTWRRYTGD